MSKYPFSPFFGALSILADTPDRQLPGLERSAPAAELSVRIAGYHVHGSVYLPYRRGDGGHGKAPDALFFRSERRVSLSRRHTWPG